MYQQSIKHLNHNSLRQLLSKRQYSTIYTTIVRI